MTIRFDWSFVNDLLALSGPEAFWYFFKYGGGVVILLTVLWGIYKVYIYNMQLRNMASHDYILLAIDIPKDSEQTPKAVEHLFAHLAGAHSSLSRREQYLFGKVQKWFSLEIASIEGYVQFFIRTSSKFRDLVEASIYAQYPDAEITEVEDYTYLVPVKKFPDPEWDMWGVDFILVKDQAYPLRTYPQFEHGLTQEFKDPMSAMLENLSLLGRGEHLWFQIIIIPIGQKTWKAQGDKLVKKLIGAKVEEKPTGLDKILQIPATILGPFFEQIFSSAEETRPKQREFEPISKMLYLSPGESDAVKAIEGKLSKIGYKTKLRGIYIAKKEVMKKSRGANPLVGAIKQFNTVNLNSLKPELSKTGVSSSILLFKKRRLISRKNFLLSSYRFRDATAPTSPYVLNTEELASLWHFPSIEVKAPFVKKTEAKKGEPPMMLPYEREVRVQEKRAQPATEEYPADLPPNLPIEK
ncbi:hypothetical protein KJ969_03735 [Patescibacteria group bacterium]|nr:hypothetical protein [Patescibacteria group bacterium]MBU1922211.1 hypothetical protein [Patescibacteria group bacterium]